MANISNRDRESGWYPESVHSYVFQAVSTRQPAVRKEAIEAGVKRFGAMEFTLEVIEQYKSHPPSKGYKPLIEIFKYIATALGKWSEIQDAIKRALDELNIAFAREFLFYASEVGEDDRFFYYHTNYAIQKIEIFEKVELIQSKITDAAGDHRHLKN